MRDTKTRTCPFQPQKAKADRRWKVLLWGPTGTLKTRTALQFPSPAVIDLERGTDCYASDFQFSVLPPGTSDDVVRSVKWLRDNRHEFRTLVIDPITLFWSALQRKWSDIFLSRLTSRPGHKSEFYELGPKEWSTIKSDFAEFVAVLLQLDMNLVVVAHDKTRYAKAGGDFMTAIGESADTEKNMERIFDVIIRCERIDAPQDPTKPREGPKFLGRTIKDRTNRLPETFALTYDTIAEALGRESLDRPATPREAPTADQLERIDLLVRALELPDVAITSRLQAFGVTRFAELKQQDARGILSRLESAFEARQAATVDAAAEQEPAKKGAV